MPLEFVFLSVCLCVCLSRISFAISRPIVSPIGSFSSSRKRAFFNTLLFRFLRPSPTGSKKAFLIFHNTTRHTPLEATWDFYYVRILLHSQDGSVDQLWTINRIDHETSYVRILLHSQNGSVGSILSAIVTALLINRNKPIGTTMSYRPFLSCRRHFT